MKKFKYILVLLLMFLLLPTMIKADSPRQVTLYLFHSKTCIHCQAEREFLEKMKDKYSNLIVKEYEISNPDNATLAEKVKKVFNNKTPLVPYTTIGTRDYVGFNSIVESQIEQAIIEYTNKDHCNKTGVYLKEADDTYCSKEDIESMQTIPVPILGDINPKSVSLPLLATVLGTIDGFNPCAMWVLIFLITMLIGMHNRKKMWVLGLTFLVTSALIYLLFMVAWLNITIHLTSIFWVRLLIALVALIGGTINIRSYFKAHESGCEVVDTSKRKKIIAQIKKFTAEKSFILALLGVMALAVSVNVIELACSAGLPIIFTQILALNDLSSLEYAIYILIYILFFLIDDIIIFTIAMVSLKVTGISTKYTKYSHLIGGIIMLLIGILLVLKPEWLAFSFK